MRESRFERQKRKEWQEDSLLLRVNSGCIFHLQTLVIKDVQTLGKSPSDLHDDGEDDNPDDDSINSWSETTLQHFYRQSLSLLFTLSSSSVFVSQIELGSESVSLVKSVI